MKSLIVYSSRTGNTEKVAQAIAKVCPNPDVFSVDDAPPHENYDFIAIGYWVDKGMPDAKCAAYMKSIKGKNIGLFGTLGAYPDSDHAKSCMEKAAALLEGNKIINQFICQGRVDPKILAHMEKVASTNHPMTKERQARIEEAKKHPNQDDFEKAQRVFSAIVSSITL